MAIPESQLEIWSHQGAITTAKRTHESIRTALAEHEWPEVMRWEAYLQGSYKNSTNIRGNSDVDLVVEGGPSFYHSGLTEDQKRQLGITPAQFNFAQFRNEVIAALTTYYSNDLIDTTSSDKCIRVIGGSGRLNADVIPCMEYRRYKGTQLTSKGMTFFTIPGDKQIINHPKLHYQNGVAKNGDYRTWGRFKGMVRVFKNAREHFTEDANDYSSYFIECLMYNVPDECYLPDSASSYVAIVNYLSSADISKYVTQSQQEFLFGDGSTQWSVPDAKQFVHKLAELWKRW